jgi:hypothetical protein
MTSSDENRHMTAVDGVWSVTVGYSSSDAGTSNVGAKPARLAEALPLDHDSVVGETTADRGSLAGDVVVDDSDDGEVPVAAPADDPSLLSVRVGNGAGTTTPLMLKLTLAFTMTPSHVSNEELSSKNTRQPTVAPYPYAPTDGSSGEHHWPDTRICPVVHMPTDPCQEPRSVLGGISSVDRPIDIVTGAFWTCRSKLRRGMTVTSK